MRWKSKNLGQLFVLLLASATTGGSAEGDRDPWEAPLLSISELPSICQVVAPTIKSETAVVEFEHQVWPRYVAVIEQAEFWVGLDEQDRVRYLSTRDEAFATPEGVRVGWSLGDLQARFAAEPICDPGSSCFVHLPSGWSAGFPGSKRSSAGKAITYEAVPPESGDRASYVFKRGECNGDAVIPLSTGSGDASEAHDVSIGFGCVQADRGWRVTITASGVDSFAGHIEPSDGSWRVNWLSGMWEDFLEPSDSNRIISKRTESIRDRNWRVGLVEQAGDRFWVASDGFVQFSVPAGTPDAVKLLRNIAGRFRNRTDEMKCESPVGSK